MSHPPIVELKHVGARNKGANMMLQCAVSFLEEFFPELAPALPASTTFNFEERRRFRSYQKVGHIKYGLDWSYFSDLLPSLCLRKFGVVSHKHVRVVLDCSGFAYGHQWPAKILAHAVRHARVVSRTGGKYILLPQAFGPFTTREEVRLLRKLVDYSDLVFARDKTSKRYLDETVGESNKVLLAPDFTATLEPKPLAEAEHLIGKKVFTLVPNYKMFSSDSPVDRKIYLDVLLDAVRWASENDYEICLLNHEGQRDRAICDEISERSGVALAIYSGSITANQAKWLISCSRLMLSSRYHACVSALSQGVPAVGTSWSHKYQELYSDYGVPSLLYGFDRRIEDVLSAAADEGQLRSKLLGARDEQLTKIADMWGRVRTSIESTQDVD